MWNLLNHVTVSLVEAWVRMLPACCCRSIGEELRMESGAVESIWQTLHHTHQVFAKRCCSAGLDAWWCRLNFMDNVWQCIVEVYCQNVDSHHFIDPDFWPLREVPNFQPDPYRINEHHYKMSPPSQEALLSIWSDRRASTDFWLSAKIAAFGMVSTSF